MMGARTKTRIIISSVVKIVLIINVMVARYLTDVGMQI